MASAIDGFARAIDSFAIVIDTFARMKPRESSQWPVSGVRWQEKSPRWRAFFFFYSISSEYQFETKVVPTVLAWKWCGMRGYYFGETVET
jgi:hypothetical protein